MKSRSVYNKPGLTALSYRIGTHSSFTRRMLERLRTRSVITDEGKEIRPLFNLKTEDKDEPVIAIADAWASVLDALTFYQERIANESYLSTAIEPRSVLELARSVGYGLFPGMAAKVFLAFNLNDAPGSKETVEAPKGIKVMGLPSDGKTMPVIFETDESFTARLSWNKINIAKKEEYEKVDADTVSIRIKGVNSGLKKGDPILILGDERSSDKSSEKWHFAFITKISLDTVKDFTFIEWKEPLSDKLPLNPNIYALKEKGFLFGGKARNWKDLTDDMKAEITGRTAAECKSLTEYPDFKIRPDGIDLDALYDNMISGGNEWMVLMQFGISPLKALYKIDEVTRVFRSDFGISDNVTRIKPDTEENLASFNIRETVVYMGCEELKPISSIPLLENTDKIVLEKKDENLKSGQYITIKGKDINDKETEELARIKYVEDAADFTLVLESLIKNAYMSETVFINGNVVSATHGETIADEILGSGDGRIANQRFFLKRSPLTYIEKDRSTLEVRVNGLLWKEVPFFHEMKGTERCYIVRIDADGRASVIFGDGKNGARLPSGYENAAASYRIGMGAAGNVGSGTLILPQNLPMGIAGVFNSAPAFGGEDPETYKETVKKLPRGEVIHDRIVSLSDYENFAGAYPAVGKAKAVELWTGDYSIIHITLAGANGKKIDETSDMFRYLLEDIKERCSIRRIVRLQSYEPVSFGVSADIVYDASFRKEDVEEDIFSALSDAFSFEKQEFGKGISASIAVKVIQKTPGVTYLNFKGFVLADNEKLYQSVLCRAAGWDRESKKPAPADIPLFDKAKTSLNLFGGNYE